ncbi:WLM domain-containing protein [Podospora appendiculata]|uniref:WLM domain-containing protein n=1 Tax=Podospora appendiculata TaxID=314037 RepID=A0AAE0XIM3_9PEZI|nr:WLM domain-containing protein [Podospora appendiculata]
MAEHNALVLSFSHLKDFPREKEALHSLKKIASLVKPIMRARGWKVAELAEFYPDQQNLLGLNVNRGQRILLRLRYPGDRNQFLPIEQVTDTMLHELSHIVHGPHDAKFNALWNQLRDEHEGLVRKGYTGEGFLSNGRVLGGQRLPMHEARRLARVAAEKRRTLSSGSGQRLGGAAPRPGQDMRNVIARAIERRNRTLQGCGNTHHNQREIQEISDTATKNGFRTQAEEDAANEAAIAQALWELVQEDEKTKYGSSYIPPSAQNPTGNGGGAVMSGQNGYEPEPEPEQQVPSVSTSSNSQELSSWAPPIPVATKPSIPPTVPSEEVDGWACDICTLINPATFLCCGACETERPAKTTQSLAASQNKRPRAVVDLTSSPARSSKSKKGAEGGPSQAPASTVPATWQCSFCGNIMLREWWTCSSCGKMKDNSK